MNDVKYVKVRDKSNPLAIKSVPESLVEKYVQAGWEIVSSTQTAQFTKYDQR